VVYICLRHLWKHARTALTELADAPNNYGKSGVALEVLSPCKIKRWAHRGKCTRLVWYVPLACKIKRWRRSARRLWPVRVSEDGPRGVSVWLLATMATQDARLVVRELLDEALEEDSGPFGCLQHLSVQASTCVNVSLAQAQWKRSNRRFPQGHAGQRQKTSRNLS
jgi:hypothetical protein